MVGSNCRRLGYGADIVTADKNFFGICRVNSKLQVKVNLLRRDQYTQHYGVLSGLSQLISRYLENKPSNIDGNKIYDYVRSCYNDLETGYSDNPEHITWI